MNNIVVVFGGNSVEHEISIISALQLKNKYKGKYKLTLCYLKNGEFYHVNNDANLKNFINHSYFRKVKFLANKNYFKVGLKKIKFDGVFLLCHGMNCEDGTLYAYFNTLNINVISEDVYSGVIGQDKILSKKLTSITSLGYLEVNRYVLANNLDNIISFANNKEFPLILKPSKLGSSVGVYVVYTIEDLLDKIDVLLNMCDSLLIEKKLDNFEEYNIAFLRYNNSLLVSEIEKVGNNNVLTYEDKYLNNEKSMAGQSKQLPAKITKKLKKEIIDSGKTIYNDLRASGIVRIDFLYDKEDKKLYFNEINNIPGSLATYLFEKNNIQYNDLIDMLIDEGLNQSYVKRNFITSYSKNILSENDLSNVKLNK